MTEPDGASAAHQLPMPAPPIWTSIRAKLGLTPEFEIHAGHQSRVFVATGEADPVIIKMIDANATGGFVRERVELTRQLAKINPAVVGPLSLGSDLVIDVEQWQVVCYPYVKGHAPDISTEGDVEVMAVTLAMLHESLATLADRALPPVAALRSAFPERQYEGQLIHGDYADTNLIVTPAGLRIIDFDDCGHGTVAFDVGNSLFMVLFDCWHSGRLDRYQRFRTWFVDAYRNVSSATIADKRLDDAIVVRATALGRWLTNPAEAPIGIRTSSPEWQQRLQSFVDEFGS